MHVITGRAPGQASPGAGRTRVTGLLAALALVVTSFAAGPGSGSTAQAADPAYPPSTSTDYIAAKFGLAPGGHVFDVVTAERLTKEVLGVDGQSIVLLGSPKNDTTKATLSYVNEVAKDWGIKKIYFFDPFLGGELGADITDQANGAPYQSATTGIWETLKTYVNTGSTDNLKGARLKYIDSAYTSADTYLFVYDRKAGGSAIVDSASTILSDLLVSDPSVVADQTAAAAFRTSVAQVFTQAGWTSGNTTENRYDQYHFFTNVWTSANPAVDALVPSPKATKFTLQSVTAPELINILDTPGTHNVFVSGSWCPDSRSLVSYVAENAAKAGEPVYVFDFRSFANVSATFSYLSTEETTYTGIGFIGAELIKRLAPYNSGTVNIVGQYRPGGDRNAALATNPNRNFRSPFLARYTKANDSAKGTVGDEWVHVTKEWEAPYKTASGYEAGQVPGAYLDYEVSTGGTNQLQNAEGRASLAEFFGFPSVHSLSGYSPSTSVSTVVNKDDNGCGDDNDPLNDLGEPTLLPNQGTDAYDVQNYTIAIDFNPTKIDAPDSITGKTTVDAVASEPLSRIELDFRQQAVDKASVVITDKTGGSTVAVDHIEQVNQDDQDLQKLVIYLKTTVPTGHEFTAYVPYTTGALDYFVGSGQSPQGFFRTVDGTGVVAIGEPVGSNYWFPNNNTPADGATYDITLTYPSGYEGVSAGNRLSRSATKSVWHLGHDTAPYQLFAAIGKYTSIGGTGTNVLTLTDGSTVPYYDYASTSLYTTDAGRARDRVDSFTHELPLYLRALEKIAGPYPGEAAGFVFDNVGDGHGSAATFGAVETRDRPYFTSSGITGETTFVHELAHQWYGDAVRIADWGSLWLNEGFATYVTDLYYEQKDGSSFDANAKYKKVYETTPAGREWWTYAPAKIEKESDLFGGASAAYKRGALALAALRSSVGDDDFFTILKQWPQQYAGKAVTTPDFVDFAARTANVDLTTWASDWLYGQTRPAAWPTRLLKAGSSVTPAVELNGGNAVTIPVLTVGSPIGVLPSPSRAGYTFAGWYVNGSLIDQGFVVPNSGSLTLEARWTADSSTTTPKPTPVSLTAANVGAIADQTYTGKAIKPSVTVTVDGVALASGTDFTVAYSANVKVGTARVTITAKGSYTGTVAKTFRIVPKKVSVSSLKAGSKKVTVKWKKVSGATKYQIRYQVAGSAAWKTVTAAASSRSKAIKQLKAGKTYLVQVRAYQTVAKVKYYGSWSASKAAKAKK